MRPLRTRKASRLNSRAILLCSALALAGCYQRAPDPSTQIGPHPALPAPQQYLMPPMHVAQAVGWQGDERPTVPRGLRIEPLARNLMHPRMPYVLPNGDVLVVESSGPPAPVHRPKELIMGWVQNYAGAGARGGNRITLLRDTNGDGRPDLRRIFLDNLNSPFGLTLVGQDLYVANTDAVMHYRYTPGQTQISEPGERLVDLPAGPINHHWTKGLLASPDGSKLYVSVGSNSNITENGMEAERARSSIWEVDRATGASRIFASGLRNPIQMQWEPQSRRLWVVVNERDEIGPNLVPDYMTSVRDGGFYGWPYSYYGQHLDPRVMPQRPDLVARAIPPDYALSSHVAPLGLVFNQGTGLPPVLRGGAFVAEHGSWDRGQLNGYKVVFVPFVGGRPAGVPRVVVNGFLDSRNRARGRPVGLAMDRSGALLIADDLGDTLWRVSSAAGQPVDRQANANRENPGNRALARRIRT